MRMSIAVVMLLGAAMILVTGGDLYAAHSDHGCNNCHVPHKAGMEGDADASWGVPLWSTAQTADGLPTFTLYSSKTFDALGTDIGQPDGATKLCLGCHDGSYHVFTDYLPDSEAIFAPEDLARTHPISFTYDATLVGKTNGGLKATSELSGLGGTIAEDLLDIKGKMQCSSCHDVHTTGLGEYLLRIDDEDDQVLCRVCHNK